MERKGLNQEPRPWMNIEDWSVGWWITKMRGKKLKAETVFTHSGLMVPCKDIELS